MPNIDIYKKLERKFIAKDFKIENWESIKPYFDQLLVRNLDSITALNQWLLDKSELESVLEEESGWRYIHMSCDTANEDKQNAYNYFITEIDPHIQPISNKLDKKLLNCTFKNSLTSEGDVIFVKSVENAEKIFREANIALFTEMQQAQVRYGTIVGGLMAKIDGVEMTLPQASNYMFNPDRKVRESAYFEIQKQRLSVKNNLDELFDNLLELRNKIAINAEFSNYRDYMFVAMNRFDYTAKDCFDFHDAIQTQVLPIVNAISEKRKKDMQLEALKPWDLSVDTANRPALKSFENGKDLTEKTIVNFNKLDPFIGKCIAEMEKMGHLDLESRKGKAPGGYNYPLYETGVPFIFMNATGNVRDLVTMVHEGGHALHSILTKDLTLVNYKNLTSEVAELASMSMELMSMEYWDIFFENPEDLKRAKKDHLESILDTLPWVATIDAFQHWIYENPTHTHEERTQKWNEIHSRFSSSHIDWTDLQANKSNIWQKQLHLFEVPFYYIEYGMAQLGAIAVWKNFKENKQKGLISYMDALALGYTKSIGNIYETANVKFDFSKEYIQSLMAFVKSELEAL